jgi:hypothetical protein
MNRWATIIRPLSRTGNLDLSGKASLNFELPASSSTLLGGSATGILTGIAFFLTATKISGKVSGEVLEREIRARSTDLGD